MGRVPARSVGTVYWGLEIFTDGMLREGGHLVGAGVPARAGTGGKTTPGAPDPTASKARLALEQARAAPKPAWDAGALWAT
jgi:hypothetical protein